MSLPPRVASLGAVSLFLFGSGLSACSESILNNRAAPATGGGAAVDGGPIPGPVAGGAGGGGSGSLAAAAKASGRLFGAALNAGHLSKDASYKAIAAREFNYAVAEWEMKWDPTEKTDDVYNFTLGDQIADFAEENGMAIKGHTLVWYQATPAWVKALSTPDAVRTAMNEHIDTVVEHYKGRIRCWDVVNEAFDDTPSAAHRDSPFFNQLGEDYIAEAFVRARAVDPDALLFYNDYGIESPGPKLDAVVDLVEKLLAADVPIDGVGFQTHVSLDFPSGVQLAGAMKRITDLGLMVNISEIDVRLGKNGETRDMPTRLDLQAKRYADLVGACMGNELCESITVWGVTDQYSWLNVQDFDWAGPGPHDPLLFSSTYEKKAAYDSTLAVLLGE